MATNNHIACPDAAPEGAVFPVVTRFEVTLPTGENMAFKPCEVASYDNSYLLLSGELVTIQTVGKDRVSVMRPNAPEQIMSRRDASNLVAATRISDPVVENNFVRNLIDTLVDMGAIRRVA